MPADSTHAKNSKPGKEIIENTYFFFAPLKSAKYEIIG